jgi:hypothetical protein
MLLLSKKKKKRPGEICPPFEWLEEEIDLAITAGIDAGICTVGELTAATADVVYPKFPDGKLVGWPKAPPWVPPMGANEAVQCIWDELEDRVRERLDALPEGACAPPENPSDVIKPFVSRPKRPRWGTFYQIVNRDLLINLVKAALGTREGDPLNAPAVRCVTSSEWNLTYYGTPWDPANELFPRWSSVQTDEGRQVISKAFLPRHENALAEMYAGRYPERAIDNTMAGNSLGIPGANSYGLLWFPVTRVLEGTLVCPDGNWPDGRPKTEPPPEILAVLS